NAMLGSLTTQEAALLLQVQTKQELMRATTSGKQSSAKRSVAEQQEAIRLLMSEKQTSMKIDTEAKFESMRHTIASKLLSAKGSMNDTMKLFASDYESHLGSLKRMNSS